MKQMSTILAVAALLVGCGAGGEPWRQVADLPYLEQVGTVTQYKHFVRGGYALSPHDTYLLAMDWDEGGSVEVLLAGESGHVETLTVESGSPCPFAVPEEGLYQIQLSLDGLEMSDLSFQLSPQP